MSERSFGLIVAQVVVVSKPLKQVLLTLHGLDIEDVLLHVVFPWFVRA